MKFNKQNIIDVFLGIFILLGMYSLIWIAAILDIIYNQ